MITRTVKIDLTPEEVAQFFCEMCSDEQAAFFNHVGEIAASWPIGGWSGQAAAIAQEDGLAASGGLVILTLAEHLQQHREKEA